MQQIKKYNSKNLNIQGRTRVHHGGLICRCWRVGGGRTGDKEGARLKLKTQQSNNSPNLAGKRGASAKWASYQCRWLSVGCDCE